jgi:hypothetical protein
METEIRNEARNKNMRYIQPKITGTFNATSTIKSMKIALPNEVGSNLLTNGAAYQADE